MTPQPENNHPPGSPGYWKAMWEQALYLHGLHGNVTLHSKHPQEPPEGYIRLGYAANYGDDAQGPNCFYIQPSWIGGLRDSPESQDEGGRYWMWWREPKRRGENSAHIDAESYALAQAHYYQKPRQLFLL